MPFPESVRNTNGFDKNPENINRNGKPKKIYTIIREHGYSKADTITAFGELSYYTIPDLRAAKSDDELPAIVRIIANQLIKAFDKGNWTLIKEIMEYTLDKPIVRTKDESERPEINFISKVPPDELKKGLES